LGRALATHPIWPPCRGLRAYGIHRASRSARRASFACWATFEYDVDPNEVGVGMSLIDADSADPNNTDAVVWISARPTGKPGAPWHDGMMPANAQAFDRISYLILGTTHRCQKSCRHSRNNAALHSGERRCAG
jgi:hypothetical protein